MKPDLGPALRELHPNRVMPLAKADNYGSAMGTKLDEAACPPM
jgi:hypothetical protein